MSFYHCISYMDRLSFFFYRSYNLYTRNLCSLEHKFKCRKTPCPPSNLLRKSCLAMGRGGVRGPRARGRVPPAAGGKHSPWTSSLSAESHRAARNFCENLMVFRGLPRACWVLFSFGSFVLNRMPFCSVRGHSQIGERQFFFCRS